jgi:uncharacterized protein YndB with AHSA1/START domain
MPRELVAHASRRIDATPDAVWRALTDPAMLAEYMFGATVVSDWQPGSSIVWRGEYQGRPYEDKGRVLRAEPGRVLEYTHFSPLAGLPDEPENYHRVTLELAPETGGTRVTLAQDNNLSEDARQHSERNWGTMLDGLKRVVEGRR